jgi:hypothetical protein
MDLVCVSLYHFEAREWIGTLFFPWGSMVLMGADCRYRALKKGRSWCLGGTTSGRSNRSGFDSIRFSSIKLQKPFDSIRFHLDSVYRCDFKNDSIWHKIASAVMKIDSAIKKWTNFPKHFPPGWQNYLKIYFAILFCELFELHGHCSWFLLLKFVPGSNKIESYRRSKCLLICIRFD